MNSEIIKLSFSKVFKNSIKSLNMKSMQFHVVPCYRIISEFESRIFVRGLVWLILLPSGRRINLNIWRIQKLLEQILSLSRNVFLVFNWLKPGIIRVILRGFSYGFVHFGATQNIDQSIILAKKVRTLRMNLFLGMTKKRNKGGCHWFETMSFGSTSGKCEKPFRKIEKSVWSSSGGRRSMFQNFHFYIFLTPSKRHYKC